MSIQFRGAITAALVACAACAGAASVAQERPFVPSLSESPVGPSLGAPADPADRGPVSLEGILAYADQHAPRLLVARSRQELAEADVAAASPLLPANPVVTGGVSSRNGADGSSLDWSLELAQSLEIAGQRGLRGDAAKLGRDVARLVVEEVRWAVHHDVHEAFHIALLARSRLRTAERALSFAETLTNITQRRLAAGEISPLPVRLAEGELAQARQARIAAGGAYLSARLMLAEISGWPSTAPPEPAGELDRVRAAPDIADLLALATSNHPRLRSRAAAVRAAVADEKLADREAWPDPALGVSYEHESAPGVPDGGEDVAGVFLAVPLPVWQRNPGPRARARANVAIAEAELTAVATGIRARVARAAARVDTAAARLDVYGEEILPAFEDNLDLLERAFELGEIEVLDVMVAQERFLATQFQALDAYEEYYQAVADLEATVGAELWPEESHAHDEGAER